MFRLNFWSHQPLSGPVTGPPPSPAGLLGLPGPLSLPPFYTGLPSIATSCPQSATPSLLLHNSHHDAVSEYNVAAATASFWRHGLVPSGHVTDRTPSPDTQKRLSPGEYDRTLQSGTMTSYPVGPGSFDNLVGSQASFEFRQSLYLRSQLVALRKYQQHQLEAKYHPRVTCASPDSPMQRRTGSTATTGSDTEANERVPSDRKRSRTTTDGRDKRGGSWKSRDGAACTGTSPISQVKRRSVMSRNRVTSSPETPSERGLYLISCILSVFM